MQFTDRFHTNSEIDSKTQEAKKEVGKEKKDLGFNRKSLDPLKDRAAIYWGGSPFSGETSFKSDISFAKRYYYPSFCRKV